MTNEEMAKSAIRLSSRILEEARRHREKGAWNLAVRRSQEAVELSLKGLLRFLGLEIPKVHDVGGFLRKYRDRLPTPVECNLDRVTRISRLLREEREISFYGNEVAGFAPDELYTEEDADRALLDAEFVYGLCEGVIETKEPAD